MTPAYLDTLAALVGQLPTLEHFVGVRGCEVFLRSTEAPFCDTERPEDAEAIVALVNAAPDLLRLARRGLEVEAQTCETCQHKRNIHGADWCFNPQHDLEVETLCADFGNRCGAWKGRTA
jgi:hypothetical protein